MSDWNAGSASTFEAPPAGAHAAKLIKIIDLGTQKGEYKGEPNSKRQVHLTWELPNELMEDKRPYTIGKFYTASVSEKANLRKDLLSWFGKEPKAPFTVEEQKKLLGKPCQVIVSEREDTGKRVISGIAPLPKGMVLPEETHNEQVFFSLDEFTEDGFEKVSEFFQKKIMDSPEYLKAVSGEVAPAPDADGDIPW